MGEIAVVGLIVYLALRASARDDERRRELKEINDRRAALEVQQRVLLTALDRLRMMK